MKNTVERYNLSLMSKVLDGLSPFMLDNENFITMSLHSKEYNDFSVIMNNIMSKLGEPSIVKITKSPNINNKYHAIIQYSVARFELTVFSHTTTYEVLLSDLKNFIDTSDLYHF